MTVVCACASRVLNGEVLKEREREREREKESYPE